MMMMIVMMVMMVMTVMMAMMMMTALRSTTLGRFQLRCTRPRSFGCNERTGWPPYFGETSRIFVNAHFAEVCSSPDFVIFQILTLIIMTADSAYFLV